MFAVNLGIYVPEVALYSGSPPKAWIQEYDCCVRARLGELIGEGKEIWWHARASDDVTSDVRRCIEDVALPFLDRFATRDKILTEWAGRAENMGASHRRDCLSDYSSGPRPTGIVAWVAAGTGTAGDN